jgi:hypothetical protein
MLDVLFGRCKIRCMYFKNTPLLAWRLHISINRLQIVGIGSACTGEHHLKHTTRTRLEVEEVEHRHSTSTSAATELAPLLISIEIYIHVAVDAYQLQGTLVPG